MADVTVSDYDDLLLEAKGEMTENYPTLFPLLGLIKRDFSRTNYSGKQVRVPILLNDQEGGGLVAEGGTVNDPEATETTQAHVKLCRLVVPFGITDELDADSQNNVTSWARAVTRLMKSTMTAHGRLANFLYNGDGTALIAACTATNSASTTVDVGTGADFYFLKPGRFVDVRTRSTGALVTNGERRKITAVSKSAGEVTVDVAISTTANEGLYIRGSYGDPNGLQGVQAGLVQSGTFEGVNLSTFPQFKAVDGRNGTTTATDLSEPILDEAVTAVMEESGEAPDWWIGDPRVLNRYAQTHLSLQRFPGESRTLDTGFDGVKYRKQDMYFDFDHKKQSVTGVNRDGWTIYSETNGPDWYRFPHGGMFDQFNRSFTREAWLHDRMQIGWHQPNLFVFCNNLNQSS